VPWTKTAPFRFALLAVLCAIPLEADGRRWHDARAAPLRAARSVFHNAGHGGRHRDAPEIVRVRFAPGPAFGRDHSYAS